MATNSNTAQPFMSIKNASIMAEQVLDKDFLRGTLTLPVFDVNTGGVPKPRIVTIPFHLEGTFGFTLGNDWKPLIDMSQSQFFTDMFNIYSAYTGESQVALASRAMQLACWKGSEIPEFTINMTFVATRRSYNPVEIIKVLSKTCLPMELSEVYTPAAKSTLNTAGKAVSAPVKALGIAADWVGEQFKKESVKNVTNQISETSNNLASEFEAYVKNAGLAAPLYYNGQPTHDKSSATAGSDRTLSLTIGNWFNADYLIVKNLSNVQFSKEIIAPKMSDDMIGQSIYPSDKIDKNESSWGFPVYAKCSMTLRPITYLSADEFMQYFKASSQMSPIQVK